MPASELSAAAKGGHITLDEYRMELIKRGYSESDAGTMTKNLETSMAPKKTAAPKGRGTGTKYGGPAREEYRLGQQRKPAVRPSERAAAPSTQPPAEEPVTPYPKGKGTGTKYGGPIREEHHAGARPTKRPAASPEETAQKMQHLADMSTRLAKALRQAGIRSSNVRSPLGQSTVRLLTSQMGISEQAVIDRAIGMLELR
jgi:hypothetical protein